jgi:hypothetical protein
LTGFTTVIFDDADGWRGAPTVRQSSTREQEFMMSGINGDKSRFHRERKQKIARRERHRVLMKRLATAQKPTAPPSEVKAKAVSE